MALKMTNDGELAWKLDGMKELNISIPKSDTSVTVGNRKYF